MNLESQIQENDSQELEKKVGKSIRRFAWGTILLSALVFGVLIAVSAESEHMNPLGKVLFAASFVCFALSTIAAIASLHRRSSSSISWAASYFIMLTLMSVLFASEINFQRSDDTFYVIILAVISVLGLVKVLTSDVFDSWVPGDKRVVSQLAVAATVIYAISLSCISADRFICKNDLMKSKLYSQKYIVTQSFKQLDRQCPMEVAEGVYLTNVMTWSKEVITLEYKLDVDRKDADRTQEMWDGLKQEVLDSYVNPDDEDLEKLVSMAFGNGYIMRFEYYDRNNRRINSFDITPDDYFRALAE